MLFTSCSTVLLIFYCYHKNLRSKALIGAKPFIWDVWTAFAVLLVVNTIAQYCIFFLQSWNCKKSKPLFNSAFSILIQWWICYWCKNRKKVQSWVWKHKVLNIFHDTFNWALTGENGKYSASFLKSPFYNFW